MKSKLDTVTVPLEKTLLGEQVLTIKVRNVGELVAKEGGKVGALAYGLTPQTISNMVYGKMQSELKAKLQEQGVKADVDVTYTPPSGGKSPKDLLVGVGIGVGVVGIAWLLKSLIRRGR